MESKYIDLVINRITQAQYDELKINNQISEEEIYNIIDHDDLFYYKTETYSKIEIENLLSTINTKITNLTNNQSETNTEVSTIKTDISNIDSDLNNFKAEVNDTYATKEELDNFSPVAANPGYSSGSPELTSVKIDGIDYRVFPQGTIELSNERLTGSNEYTLYTIKIGDDVWIIPSGSGTGTEVIANPELSGNEASLTSISIGDIKYKLEASSGGGSVEADGYVTIRDWTVEV